MGFYSTVIGNAGSDAELKYLPDGKPVLNVGVASTKRSKKGDITTWVRVNYYGAAAEKVAGYITKGKQIAVSGEVFNREYEKDGQKRFSLEIDASQLQLLGGKEEATKTSTAPAGVTSTYVANDSAPF